MPAPHPASLAAPPAAEPRAGRWWRAAALAVLLLALQWMAGLLVPLISAALLFLLLSAPAEMLRRRGLPAACAAGLLVFVPALASAALALALLPRHRRGGTRCRSVSPHSRRC